MRKSEKEALQAMLDDEQETIKALEKAYQRALRRIDNHIRILESDEMTQSKIYQKRYQEAMKAQTAQEKQSDHRRIPDAQLSAWLRRHNVQPAQAGNADSRPH